MDGLDRITSRGTGNDDGLGHCALIGTEEMVGQGCGTIWSGCTTIVAELYEEGNKFELSPALAGDVMRGTWGACRQFLALFHPPY